MSKDNKPSQYKFFECPFCGYTNFVLKVDERIALAFSKSNHFFDVEYPRSYNGREETKTIIRFKVMCEKCRKELRHTKELVEAIDFYIS